MPVLAIFGAGGNMGTRAVNALVDDSDFSLLYVETSEKGQSKLKDRNLKVTSSQEALEVADFVLLAVPDALIGTVAHSVVPKMKSGAMMICLDPAAPFGGQLPTREDVSYFVVHPAHPPIFNDEPTMEARRDFFGSNIAKQSIVCALMQGPESDYAKGEQIGIKLFQPILRSHRVTVEQMATLEPVLSETVAATCLSVIREALDETVRRGVPHEAARDFLLGHLNIELAILFDETHWEFSAGCKKAIEDGKSKLIKPDWKRVFERDEMLASVESITGKIIQQVESE